MSSRVPPASSTAAFTFSHTWRVWTSILPRPATQPSGTRAVMPEMKTSLPCAAIAVAWEKWPFGLRSLLEVICCFMVPSFFQFSKERVNVDTNAFAGRGQAIKGLTAQRNRARIALMGRKRQLTRCIDAFDAGSAPGLARALRLFVDAIGERLWIREPVYIERYEHLAATIRLREIAIKRTHLRTDRTVRQAAAQKGDDEGETKPFRAGGPREHSFDRLIRVGGRPAVSGHSPVCRDWLARGSGPAHFAHRRRAERHIDFDWMGAAGRQRESDRIVAGNGFGPAGRGQQRPCVRHDNADAAIFGNQACVTAGRTEVERIAHGNRRAPAFARSRCH